MNHRIEYEHYFECDVCEGDWVMYDLPISNVVYCPHCSHAAYVDSVYGSIMHERTPLPSIEEQRVINDYFNEVN